MQHRESVSVSSNCKSSKTTFLNSMNTYRFMVKNNLTIDSTDITIKNEILPYSCTDKKNNLGFGLGKI